MIWCTISLLFPDSSGFDYVKVYDVAESAIKSKLDNSTYLGGESTVVILIPRSPPSESQKNYLEEKRNVIRKFLPGDFTYKFR